MCGSRRRFPTSASGGRPSGRAPGRTMCSRRTRMTWPCSTRTVQHKSGVHHRIPCTPRHARYCCTPCCHLKSASSRDFPSKGEVSCMELAWTRVQLGAFHAAGSCSSVSCYGILGRSYLNRCIDSTSLMCCGTLGSDSAWGVCCAGCSRRCGGRACQW